MGLRWSPIARDTEAIHTYVDNRHEHFSELSGGLRVDLVAEILPLGH